MTEEVVTIFTDGQVAFASPPVDFFGALDMSISMIRVIRMLSLLWGKLRMRFLHYPLFFTIWMPPPPFLKYALMEEMKVDHS